MKIDELKKEGIAALGLSDRARLALRRNRVHTVDDFLHMTESDLRFLRYFNEKIFREIVSRRDGLLAEIEAERQTVRPDEPVGIPDRREETAEATSSEPEEQEKPAAEAPVPWNEIGLKSRTGAEDSAAEEKTDGPEEIPVFSPADDQDEAVKETIEEFRAFSPADARDSADGKTTEAEEIPENIGEETGGETPAEAEDTPVMDQTVEEETEAERSVKKTSIYDSGLSIWAIVSLRDAGVRTVRDLLALSRDQLHAIPKIRTEVLHEIEDKIHAYRMRISSLTEETAAEQEQTDDLNGPETDTDDWRGLPATDPAGTETADPVRTADSMPDAEADDQRGLPATDPAGTETADPVRTADSMPGPEADDWRDLPATDPADTEPAGPVRTADSMPDPETDDKEGFPGGDRMAESIDYIGLSIRASNALHRYGVHSVSDLLCVTRGELEQVRNIGAKTVEEILNKKAGLRSRPQEDTENAWEDDPVLQTGILDLDLSFRATNGLLRAGIRTVGEMIRLSRSQLSAMPNMGTKSVEEVLEKIREYKEISRSSASGTADGSQRRSSDEEYLAQLEKEENRQKVIRYLEEKGVGIDVLETIPVKTYNLLRFAGYEKLYQIAFMTQKDLLSVRGMGDVQAAAEVRKNIRYYLRTHMEEILSGTGIRLPSPETTSAKSVSVKPVSPADKEKVLEYVKANDVPLTGLDLSVRALNGLYKEGYRTISDIFFMSLRELNAVRNLGWTSVREIDEKLQQYKARHRDRIAAFVAGDEKALYDEELLRERTLQIFAGIGFKGLHLPEVTEKLGLEGKVSEDTIKKLIGKLIADHELEYVDFMLFKVYPSFYRCMERTERIDDREKRCLQMKLEGNSLEAIAQGEGITRERVRQIIQKADRKIRQQMFAETGLTLFDEDYYKHLFTTYALGKIEAVEWLGIPLETFYYLDFFYSGGEKRLEESLEDPELDVSLRLKIRNYLNRNKVYLSGRWVEKTRAALEELVLEECCREEVSYDEFPDIYNEFLSSHGIPYSEKLYYTPEVTRSRSNRLAESRFVLWKQFRRLRYYDIDARDYADLLEELDLDSYENTELSTPKLLEEHPDLMARYDIRDQYELHNLLKKILPEGSYHDLHFGRMPNIVFGVFDRNEAIIRLLKEHAPITQEEFVELIHSEFGYERSTILANIIQCADSYYANGQYSVDFKQIPDTHKELLARKLTGDFYYLDELKRIYASLFRDADTEAVNAFSLKQMGFSVFYRYALRNWPSLESFFTHLMTDYGVVDLAPLRERYGNIQMWSQTFYSLRTDYEIIEIEPNSIVSFKKLESAGITKQMFRDYCDAVCAFAEDGSFFTIESLKKNGFSSDLYDFGFSDWFYANLLWMDPRFRSVKVQGTIVLYKGKEDVTTQSFYESLVKQAQKIDLEELLTDLDEDYGLSIPTSTEVIVKLKGTQVFYDPILRRLYANADLYYAELDEDTEEM